MAEIVKHINDTNASYRSLTAGDAKNTDLFFDQGHYSFFGGVNRTIKVRLHKTNLSQSILFIASILPRKYDLGAKHYKVEYSSKFVEENLAILDSFFIVDGVKTENRILEWNVRKDIMQKNGKIDDRLYLNGLQFDLPYDFNGNQLTTKFSIRNYLAGGYSDIRMTSNEDDIYDLYISNVTEAYFENDGIVEEIEEKNICLNNAIQQIYYGAPGTGKSHIINEQVCNESVIRTTFHPDSDYSTFVGCYKPTMKNCIAEVISMTELKKKLFDFKLKGEAYPCQRFAAQYWNSLINLSAKEIKEILSDCGFTEAFNVEIAKGISVGKEMSTNSEDRIVYEFVEQAFLKAYIQAWKFYSASNEEIKKQYLVIEEINRGNCAQIFGDLFQLLDRNPYGFSDYPIHADNDMKRQLGKAFKGLTISDENKDRINACYKGGKDIVQQVLNGEILLLPDNFYIWATMNTSDQSLFPIDSAFKRRWDWQYMPIDKGRDENGKDLDWRIVVNDNEYNWWSFLTKINEQIGSTTNSEDKKLGFFFCKAVNGKINAETFVGKVIFYLWNDVFKDFGFDNAIFNDEDGSTLSFDKFYTTENGKVMVCKDKVEKFLKNLGVDAVEEAEDVDEEEPTDGKFTKRHLKVVYPDGRVVENNNSTTTLIEVINEIGPAKVADLKLKISGYPMISRERIENDDKGYRSSQREINDGYWIVTKLATDAKLAKLQEISNKLNLGLQVSVER